MGTPAFQTIQRFDPPQTLPTSQFPASRANANSQGAAHAAAAPGLAFKSPTVETLLGGQTAVSENFTAAIYHAQMARVAVAMQLQQASASVAQGKGEGGTEAHAEAVQMTFDFFGEVRTEELAVFRQRTTAVADGLEGTTQETYLQASRHVAARFQMSLTISGQALSGFARASESQQNDPAGMEQLLGLAQDALAQADDVVEQILALLDGFFSGDGDFEASFTELINEIFNSGMLGLAAPVGQGALDPASPADATATAQAQSFSFSVQMEFRFEFSAQIQVEAAAIQQGDPLVLDLDDDGIELTSHTNGARFDLLGNGTPVNTAFVTGGDAFLAIDRNGNGAIDSGKELFGEQHGAAHGFAELAKLDSNGDGLINRLDRDFGRLLLFRDNGNGRTEDGELISLKDAGIAELSLRYRNVAQRAAGGNTLAQIASFHRHDGSVGRAADALLNFTA